MNEIQKKKLLEKCKKGYIKCILGLSEIYTSNGGDSGELFDYLNIPTSTIEECTKVLVDKAICSIANLTLSVKELENIVKNNELKNTSSPENIKEDDK